MRFSERNKKGVKTKWGESERKKIKREIQWETERDWFSEKEIQQNSLMERFREKKNEERFVESASLLGMYGELSLREQ